MKPKQKINFEQTKSHFWGLFKLIGKSFYRDPRGPLFLYVVPVFFLILFYFVIGGQMNDEGKVSILFSYLLLPGLTILTSLAPAIVGWKNSVFLKRIDSTGVNKSLFLVALWSFYFLVGLSGVLFQFLFAMAIGNKIFIGHLASIQWGYFFLGVFYTIILAIAIATLLGGLFNNEGVMQGLTMMIYFLSIFLSGIMLYPTLFETSEVVRIFTYLIPQKYASFLILLSQDVQGLGGAFNNANPNHPDFTAVWQMIVGGLLFIVAFFAVTNFTFKWTAKK